MLLAGREREGREGQREGGRQWLRAHWLLAWCGWVGVVGCSAGRRVCLMGTIQFVAALHEAAALLQQQQHPPFARLHVPQAKPLSPGEVLGCTAPRLGEAGEWDVLVFVADGRFHLEVRRPGSRHGPA